MFPRNDIHIYYRKLIYSANSAAKYTTWLVIYIFLEINLSE